MGDAGGRAGDLGESGWTGGAGDWGGHAAACLWAGIDCCVGAGGQAGAGGQEGAGAGAGAGAEAPPGAERRWPRGDTGIAPTETLMLGPGALSAKLSLDGWSVRATGSGGRIGASAEGGT